MDGVLVLVGTPIGNLGDLSPRAVEALRAADAIACEDTRRCAKLLTHAGVEAPPLIVVNEHEEAGRVEQVLGRLAAGERVVLVTDAGMPGFSDPGELLVRAAAEEGHRVELVPGPTAAVSALVASGLPAGRWCFEGFLPRKGSGRRKRLVVVAAEPRTTVLYEAPHRLERTIMDLAAEAGGDRRVVIARELTKLHEELWRGTLDEAIAWVDEHPPRGEIAIVLDGAPAPPEADEAQLRVAVRAELAAGRRTKDAAAAVAERLGAPKRFVYDLALQEADADA
jgi:16S rRNA (cytidine1402-2'-O)-methyltransferase